MKSSLNIIVCGETGVGKSSVINLIAGKQIAKTSPDACGCTSSAQQYTLPIQIQFWTLYIWDTASLEAPQMSAKKYMERALEQACDLIHQLSEKGGVDLMLFCIRAAQFTATTRNTWRWFCEVVFKSQVPVSIVVTNLEREADMERWWQKNESNLSKYGIRATGHACITGVPTNSKYNESRQNILKLLEEHFNGDGGFSVPLEGWISDFLPCFSKISTEFGVDPRPKDVVQALRKRCGLDPKKAKELVERWTKAQHR